MAEEPNGAATIGERAEEGEGELDGEQVSMGLIEGDRAVSLAGLIESGMPVAAEVSLMSAAVPAKGLIDPHRPGVLRVAYVVKDYDLIPLREAGVVTGWKVRMSLRPTYVEEA